MACFPPDNSNQAVVIQTVEFQKPVAGYDSGRSLGRLLRAVVGNPPVEALVRKALV
jgi:hypothetical protein